MSELDLAFLGPARISHRVKGEIAFPNRKVLALFAFLVSEAGQPHSRESLLGLLWPDLPTAAAQNNLRVTWSQLRQSLSTAQEDTRPYWLGTRLDLQFNPGSDYQLDVTRFRNLLEACRTHAHASRPDCAECAGRLAQALALVRGPFLAGLSLSDCPAFEEWLFLQRERLHLQITTALEELAEFHECAGERETAIPYVHRLLEFDPLREGAHRQLMRLLAGAGQRSAALAQYETCRRLLADELGVAPTPETILLVEQIRALATPQTAALAHNLPAALTRFIGRGAESAQLEQLLTNRETGVVTLAGPGGVGKTRLALQVAHHLASHFRQGAWLVELAGVKEAQAVPAALAAVLKVFPEAGRPLENTLGDYLRGQSILLVLDNCEHLLEPCAHLVKTLCTAAPGLVVLATSRIPLHLPGEQVLRLEPLTAPQLEPLAALTASAALQYDAIQLFASRAAQALLSFTITDANAAAVAQICHHLDGIPLAIELAAARAGFMPVQDIARRLDQRFRWLNTHTSQKLPRQQTLRALIDWSYDLLNDQERMLLKRLSVFAGGWTYAAAEAICDEQDSCTDILGHLVDQSLVVFGYDPEHKRYRMHETIRQFAREQLHTSGQELADCEKHARYYARVVASAVENQAGLSLLDRLRQLQSEHDNLRAALAWTLEHQSSLALEVVANLGLDLNFWELGGYFEDGRRWLKRVLEATRDSISPRRAKALLAAAELSSAISDFEYGQACAAESLQISLQLGDRQGEVHAQLVAAGLAALQGDYATHAARLAAALELAGRIQYPHGLAKGEHLLGQAAFDHHDDEAAIQHLLRSVALWRVLDHPYELAAALNTLAAAMVNNQQSALANEVLSEMVTIYRSLGYRRGVALGLHNLGAAAIELKAYDRAREYLGESLFIRRQLGLPRGYAYSLESLALLAFEENRAARAIQLFAAAGALRLAIKAPLDPSSLEDYAAILDQLRAGVGDVRYTIEWAKGSALTVEQAIDLALRSPETIPTSEAQG